jgi:hypothetical protein
MIESGDNDLRSVTHRRGGVEENHRIHSTGHGQERPLRSRQRVVHRALDAIDDRPFHTEGKIR